MRIYMKRIIPILFILLAGCKQKMAEVPKGYIGMDSMKVLLADMHIIDAVAESKAQMGMSEKMLAEEYYEQMFKNHGITRQKFVESYAFYEAHPELLNMMYEDILADISKREEKVGKNAK